VKWDDVAEHALEKIGVVERWAYNHPALTVILLTFFMIVLAMLADRENEKKLTPDKSELRRPIS